MMLEEIKELKENYSKKHYGIGIKKFPTLFNKIEELKNKYPGLSNTAYLYILEYNVDPVCDKGNLKSFKDYDSGFGFCGRAAKCECAREWVSNSVKETKSKLTEEEKVKQNEKRVKTNLQRYGVVNTGLLEKARKAHKETYQNKEKVESILNKMKESNLSKYGVDNVLKLKKYRIDKMLEKHKVANPLHKEENKRKQSERAKKLSESGVFLKSGYNRLKNYLRENYEWDLVTPIEEYKGVSQQGIVYKVRCTKCNTEHDLKINYGKLYPCKICFPKSYTFRSDQENDLFAFIKGLGVNCYQKDRSIINPYELDIVCPDHKIAIEYCGLYWHSEWANGKTKDYHRIKLDKCNRKGYRLITIFSDEWLQKREIVERYLKNVLGHNTNKLGARKTVVSSIDTTTKDLFLDKYHIQGTVGSTVSYALLYGNEVVALMAFRREKYHNNSDLYKTTDGYYWNLVRFATGNYLVQGGASKLLSAFIKDHNPELIVSFADLRLSEGNLYEKLGFEHYGYEPPTYYYVDRKYENRYHKFNFRKSKLKKLGYNPAEWTEKEAMMDLGYDRVWDCGKIRWVWRSGS